MIDVSFYRDMRSRAEAILDEVECMRPDNEDDTSNPDTGLVRNFFTGAGAVAGAFGSVAGAIGSLMPGSGRPSLEGQQLPHGPQAAPGNQTILLRATVRQLRRRVRDLEQRVDSLEPTTDSDEPDSTH